MTNEQEFFLDALADYLHGRATKPPEGLNWRIIEQYAASHQVEGIIWNQCKEYLKKRDDLKSARRHFETSSVASCFCYANNVQSRKELKSEFAKDKINCFFVKGLDIAALYPIPAYRTMGDMDIVMKTEDRNRISGIMKKLGFIEDKGERVRQYKKSTTRLEIHDELINGDNLEIPERRKFFNTCWEYVEVMGDGSCLLNWNFHLLFLIEHTKQHFSASGVGFRQFMDIAVVTQRKEDLDWDWIEKQLKNIKLWDFTVMTFAFLKKWWDIPSPMPIHDVGEDCFKESTDFIFKNGVFGFDNENASIHLIEKQMRVTSVPKFLRAFKVAKKKCVYLTILL